MYLESWNHVCTWSNAVYLWRQFLCRFHLQCSVCPVREIRHKFTRVIVHKALHWRVAVTDWCSLGPHPLSQRISWMNSTIRTCLVHLTIDKFEASMNPSTSPRASFHNVVCPIIPVNLTLVRAHPSHRQLLHHVQCCPPSGVSQSVPSFHVFQAYLPSLQPQLLFSQPWVSSEPSECNLPCLFVKRPFASCQRFVSSP